jgi:hypothetical protein
MDPAQAKPDLERALVSRLVRTLPVVDGEIDSAWAQAQPLTLPLNRGLDGAVRAFDVELRSLHDDETIAFLATWSGEPATTPADAIRNKLVVHWTIPTPAGGDPFSCMVACHTAFADGHDRFVHLTPETIPTGFSGPLPVGGGRHGDAWTMEWSRPLISPNPLDIQFSDPDAEYEFMVKVFLDIDGQPDAISDPTHLILSSS